MLDFKTIKQKIYERKTEKQFIKQSILKKESDIDNLNIELRDSQKALIIIQAVAKITQDNLVYRISELCSLALDSIFEDETAFKIDFVEKNNRTSCSMFLEDEDGNRINPMNSSGGGVVDILCFALRLTIHSIQLQSTRNVMILDEPFKHLSIDLQEKMSRLLKELSDKLKMQFIIVSHCSQITEHADNAIKIGKEKTGIEYTEGDKKFIYGKILNSKIESILSNDKRFTRGKILKSKIEKEKANLK